MRARILNLIHEVEYCCVSAKLDYINSAWKSVATIASELGVLISYAKDCIAEDEYLYFIGDLQDIIPRFMESQKGRDLILAADVLEAELLPWLSGKAAELSCGNADEDFDFLETNLEALEASGNYGLLKILTEGVTDSGSGRVRCDYTSSGDICFKCVDGNEFYLTGRNYPYTDALYYVYESRNDSETCYGIGGGCMIYELLALMRINFSTKAVFFEHDKELLVSIFKHINLKDVIESGRATFCYENIPQNLGKFITEINLWTKTSSVKFEKDERIRYAYEKYRRILISAKEQKYLLFFNFAENVRFEDEYVTAVADKIEGKIAYLIAGGPSLNRCFDILRNRDENSIILTVGTSAGKLLKEGIDPDFVLISDPMPPIKKQLDHPFNYDKTSLFYLCTTYNYAVEIFKGKRYIVYQKDFAKAEELAANGNYPLFLTGGSVSTLALDILLGLKVERVICLGLDLAYTYNQMHAAGIHAINDAPTDIRQNMVRATNGEKVTAPNNLNSYREWIVNRLKNYKGSTRLINVSDGAYIEGMENYTCDEYFKNGPNL